MRRRQAVGDEHDLPIRRVLRQQELPRQLQAVLDVGEVRRNHHLADIRIAHVHFYAHDRIVERHRLGHERGHLGDVPRLGERVHLDELQEIAGIFAADQAVEGQAHALDVDVLTVVAHRAGHVEQHDRGALGIVARLVDDDVFGLETHRQTGTGAQQGVGERGRECPCASRNRRTRTSLVCCISVAPSPTIGP